MAKISCGIFGVDLERPLVSVKNRTEELPVHQWQLMKVLVQAMGQPVAAEALCKFAGIQASPHHANLQNAMSRLRRRLEGVSNRIATVKGVGYRIIP
jgi:DNA-binding response OmpR family regulator